MLDYLIPFSDELTECSYLPEQTARLPLSLPAAAVSSEQFDELMHLGYRRSGAFYYCTQCPSCQACEPIRLQISKFRPNRSQRRVLRRQGTLQFQLATPSLDSARLRLFNRHRDERGLSRPGSIVDASSYRSFLLNAANYSMELSLWDDDRLVAISITDVGLTSLSAVYCFFDPSDEAFSPGTLCILKQIELAREMGRAHLYLGYYVAANQHLAYKANFRPHERRISGQWREFA